MDELTSRIVSLVPDGVLQENGVALYSGREAWDPETSNGVYIMGMNPGGGQEDHDDDPIAMQIAQRMGDLRYSSYTIDDDGWGMGKGRGNYPRGQAPFQRSLQHLARAMKIDLRATPSTNSVFVRSRRWAELLTARERQEACWPFHADMMDWLGTKVLVLIGDPGCALKKLDLDDRHRIDRFVQMRMSPNRGSLQCHDQRRTRSRSRPKASVTRKPRCCTTC